MILNLGDTSCYGIPLSLRFLIYKMGTSATQGWSMENMILHNVKGLTHRGLLNKTIIGESLLQ